MNDLNSGFILINKETGISSFDVIRKLKKQTGIRKWGHSGTLDPFATGLMICACNKYTRLLSFVTDYDKTYEAVMEFGTETSTGDTEGEIISKKNTVVKREDIIYPKF